MFKTMLAASLAIIMTAPAVLAGDAVVSCTTEPQAKWMSTDAISTLALAAGYQRIRDVKTKGSCYEVFGMTSKQQAAEVMMDPVTGEVVKAEISE